MDEFPIFLVMGLVILAILIAATNGFYVTEQQIYQNYTVPVPLDTSTKLVGLYGQDATRSESFGFAVGTDMLGQDIGYKKIFSGLLFGDSKFVFETNEDTDVVTINFRITETNNLGDIIVRVDGKVIDKRNLNIGEYSYTINGPVPSGTIIEIMAESSYWKIWAPTIYKITDIKISTTSFARQVQEFSFNLYDEYDFFKQARIEIRTAQSYGTVRMYLNDDEIFNDYLSSTDVIEFGKDKMQKGENVLRIEADSESSAAGTIDLVIFYDEQIDKELVMPFTISTTEYEKMKGGFIKFEITEVQKSGGVAIKIRAGSDTLLNEFTTAADGPVVVYFGKGDVKQGYNEIIIHGVEGATFKVKNLYVELR